MIANYDKDIKMAKITTINNKLNLNLGGGLFHDSRQDVNTLGKVINLCIDKINELVKENNKLQEKVESLQG